MRIGHRVAPTHGIPKEHSGYSFSLACPIAPVKSRRRLRIVVYARFSTDQQSPRSIGDQVAICRKRLDALGLGDVEIIVVKDEAISGEHARRPGIDRVWDLIESGGCDVIIAEDLSRLYRHSTRAMELIEAAVDAGVRVIAINSNIDTEEDESRWRMGSHFASMKAEMDNTETRKRIVRAMAGLWRDGFAVGALKPGYVRVPTTPATDREPAKGPFRDEKDANWTPTITRAYEMCAQHDMPWVIAEYLTNTGFPKSNRARLPEWTETNVIRLIRDPINRGKESYRKLQNVKKYRLGKSIQVPSPADEVLFRKMPHLAHVSDSLWKAANQAIDRRNLNTNPRTGKSNPLHRSSRDSRTALSELFVCDVCKAKMYRRSTIYQCADSRRLKTLHRANGSRCWNRCAPQLDTVHRNLARSIVETLVSQAGYFEALCAEVVRLVEQGAPEVGRRLQALQGKDAELERKRDNLTKAIEDGSDIPQLVIQLRDRELERQRVEAEIEELVARSRTEVPIPTADDIRNILDDARANLLGDFDSEAAPLLKRLIDGKIHAVPYSRFDGDSLHLRAHFTLNTLRLLPQGWQQLMNDRASDESLASVATSAAIPVVVDLFKVPKRIQYAKSMCDLVQGGLTLADAARRLGLPETTGNKAWGVSLTTVRANPTNALAACTSYSGSFKSSSKSSSAHEESSRTTALTCHDDQLMCAPHADSPLLPCCRVARPRLTLQMSARISWRKSSKSCGSPANESAVANSAFMFPPKSFSLRATTTQFLR
ncbi:MAG TPA: recombinase family protein [Phycisphaerae bacterium]|nr:recombinase family protein [Phycisphaerae bacterium]